MLTGDEFGIAEAVFKKVSRELLATQKRTRRYWALVGYMQELANHGFLKASRFMENIDITKAPSSFGDETTFKYLLGGPRTTSFKGSRRQLQADPASPHKTFGMRPHHRRGDEPDEEH